MLGPSFALLACLLSAPPEPPAPSRDGFDTLQGFTTVLVSQINAVMGSENLPTGTGSPVEPGLYVTITPERALIFDKVAATIQGGRYADATVAAECKSGCPRVVFDAFHHAWRGLAEESAALAVDLPARVLFAAHRDLPAITLLQTAYAAAETRPRPVPNLYLLLHGGGAGVRARPVFLLPPGGLAVPAGQRILGLRVRLEGGGRYTITAADPRFGRTVSVDAAGLGPALVDIKRNYPGKEALILEPGEGASVGDLAQVMVVAQEQFARIVLGGGQKIRIG
jgi:hypothetical protein